ncbi:MAG TPA: NUDIX domain-containing protein [Terriglobales bacterium]|jgi:8-oxo-dGTP pyrophosphatase MutT (NUDIX family)|nr:NUDIX domain-containing protein [Ktedonobacterales bacterium]
MSTVVEKVTAFITRDVTQGSDAARELLIFAHPSAGTQVPAGTVEPGERIEAAVLRETAEEAGLQAVTIVAHLATQTTDLAPGQAIVTSTTPLYSAPALDAPTGELILHRGWPIAISGAPTDGWSPVTYVEDDLNSSPPRQLLHCDGWIPAGCAGTRVTRHLFHLALTAPTPDHWEHLAEGRHRFAFSWTPLTPRPHLVAAQDAWLAAVYEQLRRMP